MSQTTDANSQNAFNAWSRTPGKSVRNSNPTEASHGSMFLPSSMSSRSSTSAWGSTGDSPVNSPIWAPTRPTSLIGGSINNKQLATQQVTTNSTSLMHQVSAPADCLWSTGFLADTNQIKSATPQVENSNFQSHWIDGDIGCNVPSVDKWAVSPSGLSSNDPAGILSGWGSLTNSSTLEPTSTSSNDLFISSNAATASVWAPDGASIPPNSSSNNLSGGGGDSAATPSDTPLSVSTALDTTTSQPSSGAAPTNASGNQTWAQAAGKGILPLPATAQGQAISQKASGASSAEDMKRREQDALITARVLSNDGWGQRPIDQSLPWDVTDVLKWFNGGGSASGGSGMQDGGGSSGSDANRRGGGLEPSVWVNEPPTGTGIWEDYYQNQGKKTARWQGVFGATAPNQPGTPIASNKMNSPWDSRDTSGMWPPERSNINRLPSGGWGESGATSMLSSSNNADSMMMSAAGTNNNNQINNMAWPPDKRSKEFSSGAGAASASRIGTWNDTAAESSGNWPTAVPNMDPVGRMNENNSDIWGGSSARTPGGSRAGGMASNWPSGTGEMNDMMSGGGMNPNTRGPAPAPIRDWNKDNQYGKRPIGPMPTNMHNPNNRYKGDNQMRAKQVDYLVQMGFKYEEANNALINNNMDLDRALVDLRERQASGPFAEVGDFGSDLSSMNNIPGNPRMFGNMNSGRGGVGNNPLAGPAGSANAFNSANPQIMGQQILQQMRFALNQRMQTPNNPMGVSGAQQRPSNRESMLRQNILIQKQKLQSVQQKMSSLMDSSQSRNESHQTQMQRQMLLERAQNEFHSLNQQIAQNEAELQRISMTSGGAGMMPQNMPPDLLSQMGDLSMQGSNRNYPLAPGSGKSWSQNPRGGGGGGGGGGRWMGGSESNSNQGNFFPGGGTSSVYSGGGGTDPGLGAPSLAWLLLQSIPAHLNLDTVKSAVPVEGLLELVPNMSNRWILLGYASIQYAIKAMEQLNGRAGIVQPVSENDALQKKQEIQNLATRFNLSGPPNTGPGSTLSGGLMGSPGPTGSSSTNIGGGGSSSLWGMPPPGVMPGSNNPHRMMPSDGSGVSSVFDHPGAM